jgi:His/Glu/Gln/Arg/opine family amino acid ABC transporter permease subunit
MERFLQIVAAAAPYIFKGAAVTVELVVLVILIGTPTALLVALARNSRHAVIAVPVGFLSWAMRGLPPLVILFFVYFVAPQAGFDIDPFPAALIGMTLYMTFYLAEAIRGGLAAIDQSQRLAARALALPRGRAFFRILLPQALPAIVPPYISYTTEIVKDSALAGSIAVPEMMGNASQLIMRTGRPFQILLFVGVLYVILDAVLLVVQARAERRWQTLQRH